MEKLPMSSFKEYIEKAGKSFCNKDIVLEQFSDLKEYGYFCESVLPNIIIRKKEEKELKYLLLE